MAKTASSNTTKQDGGVEGGGASGGGGGNSSGAAALQVPSIPLHVAGGDVSGRAQHLAERMAFIQQTRVRSAMVWDVHIPPAVNSIKGHFVPKFLHSNRERRISVEIRTPVPPPQPTLPSAVTAKGKKGTIFPAKRTGSGSGTVPAGATSSTNDGSSEEFTVVRIFVPSSSKEAKALMDATRAVTGGVMSTAALAKETAALAGRTAADASSYVATAAKTISAAASGGGGGGSHDGGKEPPSRRNSEASLSTLGVRGVDDSSLVPPSQRQHQGQSQPQAQQSASETKTGTINNNKENQPHSRSPERDPLLAQPPPRSAIPSAGPHSGAAGQPAPHWIEKYCLPLDNVVINKRVKNICVVTTTHAVFDDDNKKGSASTATDDLSLLDVNTPAGGDSGHPSPAGATINPRRPPGGLKINASPVAGLAMLDPVGAYKKNKTREITFQTEAEAINFDKLIRNEKKIAAQKNRKKLKHALGQSIDPGATIKLLVEISSAWDLPVGDMVSSDPFVVVKMGTHYEREVHRTKHLSKTLNPVWTIQSQSLFLLSTSSKDLFRCYEGVLFEVRDFDLIGDSEILGRVYVPPKVMYESKGERMEFDLQMPRELVNSQPPNKKPILVLRFRHATSEDLNFMADLARTGAGESAWKPKGMKLAANMLQRNSKTSETGVLIYRVRPGPDPKRKTETEWMTEQHINTECMKESSQWLEAGSGAIGQVYVEVLKCTKLPNMDAVVGGVSLAGNKTDAFACLVYEDCLVQTDVINDCCSPRWMPWSNRAFIFHTMHPSSPLYVGVFDYDVSDINNHDSIGRISVDLSKLQPKMQYILTYNLYESSSNTNREATNGTITLRIRVECDPRQRLLSTIERVPPDVYINCRRKKDFELARFTVEGESARNKYSLAQLSSYVSELTSYQIALFYIKEGLYNLMLWRGHVKVELPLDLTQFIKKVHSMEQFVKKKIQKDKFKTSPVPVFPKGPVHGGTILDLPLHSMLAFIIGITLVEHPHFIPSFWLGCFGWMMLAVMELQLSDPSPWSRFLPFPELAWILVYGKPMKDPQPIRPGENEARAKAFRKYWTEKIAKAEAEAAKRREEMLKLQNELAQQIEEAGDGSTNISTKSGGFTVDPMKPYLFPIQLQLQWIVDMLRIVRNVIVWEEFYYSFWVTCGSFALSVLFLFIPWRFLMRWTLKLVTWALLGPWMKLVDIYHFRIIESLDESGKAERERQLLETQKSTYDEMVRQARITTEEAVKLRDMKIYKFGKFIAWVPILKVDRVRDEPIISESRADPYEEDVSMVERALQEAGKNRIRVPGQHLEGTMIPKPVTTNVLVARGQPTATPVLEGKDVSSDSAYLAYVKVGSIVTGAAVMTWFAVPLMANIAKSLYS